MRSILLAVDFSAVTSRAAEQVAEIARAFSSRVCVLHVAAPDPAFVGWEPGPEVVRHQRAASLREEHRKVQEIAQKLRDGGIDAHALLVQGPTVDTILERAQRVAADLIVVGSHGHGALYRALLGSVSEGIVRAAACPVLIIPSRAEG